MAMAIWIGYRTDERLVCGGSRELGMSPRWGLVAAVDGFDRGLAPTTIGCQPIGVCKPCSFDA